MCYAAIVCFGLCPCQHNGTYTRNVYPATPTKKPAQILRFAESKNEPLSRKILGKAAQKALGKGTGPSNLAKSILVFFVTPLKMGAKSPEVVETSRLFAAASFLVQLDGGQYRTRTCDPMHVKSHPFVFFCILIIICSYFRRKSSVFTGDFLLCPSRFCPVWVTVWVR